MTEKFTQISDYLSWSVEKTGPAVLMQKKWKTSENLPVGEALIRIHHSGINYKDALAITGKGKIIRNFPCQAGIDLAGEIIQIDESSDFKVGDRVLAHGMGLGEARDGGLGQIVTVPIDWLIPLNDISTEKAMQIGTAGFTAQFAIQRMVTNGQTPEDGPIVVTGASGGVGSFALWLLKKSGFETIAVTSKYEDEHDYLKSLGADLVLSLNEFLKDSGPLAAAKYGGGIDNVGAEVLTTLLATTNPWGNVASVGLAKSAAFDAAVFPFILRGVSLLGISSANCPMMARKMIWEDIFAMTQTEFPALKQQIIPLNQVDKISQSLLNNEYAGRVLVDCA